MALVDWRSFLAELAALRPLYHSEADFQHALAWHLHETFPEAKVRLEYRPAVPKPPHLDIWLEVRDVRLAVEVKYRTRALVCDWNGESFNLLKHGAQDQARYDFLKDVMRLEMARAQMPHTSGAALMVTNDSALWKPSTHPNAADSSFRLADGTQIGGSSLEWGLAAGPGTKKGRESALAIVGRYELHWQKFSLLPAPHYGEFRYLLVEI